MKHIATMLFVTFCATGLFGQLQKGAVIVAGSGNFTRQSDESNTFSSLTLTPAAGFMLTNQFAIGAGIGVTSFTAGELRSTTLGLSPFLRLYLTKAGKARPFLQGYAGYEYEDIQDLDLQFSALRFGGELGLDFFIRDNVALEMSAGYQIRRYLETSEPIVYSDTNTFFLNFGIIGFLSKKKAE